MFSTRRFGLLTTDLHLSSHGSIDRYYALWQVLHPEKLYEENKPTHDTVDNILAPFYRSDPHGWWTSRMMQRTAGKPTPKFVCT